MPTVPTATLVTGRHPDWPGANPPEVSEGIDGRKGVQYYRVNTSDENRALSANGLPQPYSSWSNDTVYVTMLCIRRAYIYVHGTDDTVTGVNGWGLVRCEFDSGASTYPLPIQGSSYTRILSRITSHRLMFDIRHVDTAGFDRPIDNGNGAQREVGGLVAQIITFPTANEINSIINIVVQLQSEQAINQGQIVTPRVIGTTYHYPIDDGGATYNDFEIGYEAGLVRITHSLIISDRAGIYEWYPRDAVGKATGETVRSQLNKKLSFQGIW